MGRLPATVAAATTLNFEHITDQHSGNGGNNNLAARRKGEHSRDCYTVVAVHGEGGGNLELDHSQLQLAGTFYL